MVLLFIAADDDIVAQAPQHFDIVQPLAVNKGLIIVTRLDMAKPLDWIWSFITSMARYSII